MNALSALVGALIVVVGAGLYLAVQRMGLSTRYWRTIALVVGVVVQTVVILLIVSAVSNNTRNAETAKQRSDAALRANRASQDNARERAKVLRDALQAVCEQGQNIRREMNRRIKAGSVDRSVLLEALRLAATGPNNRLRGAFSHLREIERANVNFVALPIPECGPTPK